MWPRPKAAPTAANAANGPKRSSAPARKAASQPKAKQATGSSTGIVPGRKNARYYCAELPSAYDVSPVTTGFAALLDHSENDPG